MVREVYTIGYGGRTLDEFIIMLKSLGVEVLVDVRRWSKSVKRPEFSGVNLVRALRNMGMDYLWMPELGGYRKFGVDVKDVGIGSCFRSSGFRAYATYITTKDELKPLLSTLVELAHSRKVAIMCCERYPWHCHRKILSDYLVAKGLKVIHVLDLDSVVEHTPSRCATVVNGDLMYT